MEGDQNEDEDEDGENAVIQTPKVKGSKCTVSVKRLQSQMEGKRLFSDVTNRQIALKMKRKRTPPKMKKLREDGSTVTLKNTDTQCNFFHCESYSKGVQVIPEMCSKSVFTERQRLVHVGTQTECNNGQCRDEIMAILDKDFMKPFLQKLQEKKQLDHFKSIVIAIKMGLLPMDNIAWLCLLDRAKYSLCSTTTQMKYHEETLEFWNIVYLMFGNSALTVFRGSANFAQVVTKQCSRGKYDPKKGSCNFSVPSVTTLRKIDVGLQGKIEPGFIEATLQMGEEKSKGDKQFTLSFDGKKIGEGLKGVNEGDCQMLGLERPKVRDRVLVYEEQMQFAEEIYNLTEIRDFNVHRAILQRAVCKLSRVIVNIQKNIVAKVRLQNKLKLLSNTNPNEKRFKFAISQLNVKKHECQNNVKAALDLIERLLELSAKCGGLYNCYSNVGHVNVSESPLFFELLPPEHLGELFSLEVASDFVKQRSELWLNLRKLARITGSTMYEGLGLLQFTLQNEHYDTFIKGLPKVFSAEVRERMDYGSAKEVSAVATILAKIIPGFFPNCMRLVETGMKFVGPAEQPYMLEVSADGLIKCVRGQETCSQRHLHLLKGNVAVEIKCSFPKTDMPHHPHDKFPVRYVTQCLAEMAVYEVTSLLFVSWTPESTAVYIVHFDNELWNKLYHLTCILYGSEKCIRPAKWHPMSKELIAELPKFIERNVRLMCVVPSVTGSHGDLFTSMSTEHHGDCMPLYISEPDHDDIYDDTFSCSAFLKKSFTDCFHCLREPAQEVLVWMLSCKDRLQEKNMPNSAPLCYHMKGREFTIEIARELREMVRRKLHERNVDILCETYDGQFHPLIVRTQKDVPLTRIQLLKQSWKQALGMNKQKLINAMKSATKLAASDLEFLKASRYFIPGYHATGNVLLHKELNPCKLSVSSRGGIQFPEGVLAQFKFAHLTEQELARNERNNEPKKRNTKLKGVQGGERNIIASLHPDLLQDLDFQENEEEAQLSDDELPDLNEQPSALDKLLKNDRFKLLQDILMALKDFNEQKWGPKSMSDLYPSIVANAEKLYNVCIIAELKIIAKVMGKYTENRSWYDSSQRKSFNVNLISSAFESSTFLVDVEPARRKHNPPTLAALSEAVLMNRSYAATSLRVSYANVSHKYAKEKWLKNATTEMKVQIPVTDTQHELFSYPEYSEDRKQVECRTFDAVHVLTKVRGHLCRHGYSFAKKEAFVRIANEQPQLLSKSIVLDLIDPQNAFIAERVISEPVEEKCRQMGYNETANFLHLFRNWFSSMNSRGLSADDRCRAMYEMDCFLLDKIDLDKFPLHEGLQYIHGMPIKTFEAILQMNSTRFTLYSLSKGKTFNSRAVSTLPCESFFSDLTRCDREGHLYPKAPNISRLMARCVTLNYIKHNPTKAYELCTSNKSAYPVQLTIADQIRLENESESHYAGTYRDHYFDMKDQHVSQRVRRNEVTTGHQSMRCVLGVRQWFRTDESKLDPSHRTNFPINCD